jgi:DNA polymerase delta subunit 1
MAGTVTRAPAKRALAETTTTRTNVQASPRSAKKMKLHNSNDKIRPPAKTANGSFQSSQPAPSQFEETLEKMSQGMETLKGQNTEKDQQWRRPALPADFNEMTQPLIFQQIEAEEGVLNGGKPTVKLFGVTEVSFQEPIHTGQANRCIRLATPS